MLFRSALVDQGNALREVPYLTSHVFCHPDPGVIPAEICNLKQLEELSLSGNRLTGECWRAVFGGTTGTARAQDVTLSGSRVILFLSGDIRSYLDAMVTQA